ncbi:MAG TPA: ribosome small subunit-dependent GTPase A [Candidatus Limnocylindrales bacterium]|nr:ribosome small subunit-dependent GTPase A [Candidatus Limnocylindrales bacterium]
MSEQPMADALRALGWDERFATLLASEAPGLVPGRILTEERGQYLVASAAGEGPASASGRLRHDVDLDPTATWPAVGDWVALEPVAAYAQPNEHRLIQRVLPRRTAVIRRAPEGRRMPSQVLAANVDTVFVVTSMNADFNIRRLERYMTVAWESGASPVVLLSKADLASERDAFLVQAATAAPGVEVVPVSAVTGEGLEEVRAHLGSGRTVVFTGSSGVGKSSIVNALAGAPVLATAAIREDDARGRHTTTRRQLVRLAGALLIDTPGLRELGIMDGDGVAAAFEDIEGFAAACRFSDCRHQSEPGCAIRAALADGSLDLPRLDAWRKLEREAERAALATDALGRRAERRKWSAIQRSVGIHMRMKYGTER